MPVFVYNVSYMYYVLEYVDIQTLLVETYVVAYIEFMFETNLHTTNIQALIGIIIMIFEV